MPYRKVYFRQGGMYHIFNRGVSRQTIFPIEANYSYFIRLIDEHSRKREIEMIGYCLMPNHFHLLLRQGGETAVSQMMQGLCSAYTQALNRRLGRTGTLFESRFKVGIIKNLTTLLETLQYIHLNPVKARLVEHPEEWIASDCAMWIATKTTPGIHQTDIRRIQRFREILRMPSAGEYRTSLRKQLPASVRLSGSSFAF